MSATAPLQTLAATSKAPAISSRAGSLVQRRCACASQISSLTGECTDCKGKKRLQAKLSVGASNDPLELEADRVADQALAGPARSNAGGAPLRIQRFTGHVSEMSDAAPASVDRVIDSPGRALEPALRQDMEQRFGHDFSNVRVHSGSAAEQSARDVNAQAYTVGQNIVFGAGRFNSGTDTGRRLLAHELAHTIQQDGSGTLRRRTDYDVIGLSPSAPGQPSSIYFDFGSATLAASERVKVATLATPPGRALTLFGYSSEEGAPASRTAMTGRRLSAVDSALRSAGHTGVRTLTPDITRGVGQIDYRSVRAVEVVPTPVAGPAVAAHGSGVCNPVEPCGTAFTSAHSIAVAQLGAATTAVTAGTPAATAQLATLFPGVAGAKVLAGLNGLSAELNHMTTHHQCHNECDALCKRPAYANPSTQVMTLCPGYLNGTSIQDNALLLLHEGLHMVPGLTTVDTAYRSSRNIGHISGAQAATNTDSFVLLIVRLSGGAASGPPVDSVSTLSPADQAAARRALNFAEQWLLTCDWKTSQLYESISVNKGRVGGWDPAHNGHAAAQHVIGWIFGLTDPGAAPPYTAAPTQSDQEKVAGIYDRYHRYMQALWTRPITVTRNAAGPDAWASGLGNAVVVSPAFFALVAADQVLRLIELMGLSLPPADVPVARARDYAGAAQQLWWNSGRTGP